MNLYRMLTLTTVATASMFGLSLPQSSAQDYNGALGNLRCSAGACQFSGVPGCYTTTMDHQLVPSPYHDENCVPLPIPTDDDDDQPPIILYTN